MDISEASLLIQQVHNFHTDVHHLQDKLAESRLDMNSRIQFMEKDFRDRMQEGFERVLKEVRDTSLKMERIEVKLEGLAKRADYFQSRVDSLADRQSDRADVVINNNSNVDAGLRVDNIDRVDGDVFQGAKYDHPEK